jgi:hypothetical protein
MTRRCGWLVLLASSWAMAADPVPDAGATPVEPGWRLEPAGMVPDASLLAIERRERILVWTDPPPGRPAASAVLLVEAPFAAVQPAIVRALSALGRVESSTSEGPLAYQLDGWDQVLLSRHPELRAALTRRFVEPELREAARAGLLTGSELDRRLAEAEASTSSAPQDRAELPELKLPYASARSAVRGTFGLTRSRSWELEVATFDASAIFGRTVTVVSLGRVDTFPNPDYSFFKALREWSVLGPGRSPTATASVVPGEVFEALRRAGAAAAGGTEPRVADSPQRLALPVPQPRSPPRPRLVEAAESENSLSRVEVPWAELTGMLEGNRYPHDLAALADGTLLVSAEVLAGRPESAWSNRLWRLRPGGGASAATQVWQGGDGAHRLAVSASGDVAWFVGSERRGGPRRLYRYRADGGEVTSFEIALEGQVLDLEHELEWQLDDRGAPAFIVHGYAATGHREALYQRLVASEAPPARGGRWAYRVAVSSAREALLPGRMAPVRWADGRRLWTEDARGLAELDADQGRALRAFLLPPRFGGVSAGRAQWVPPPLGSPAGGWIAVGYVGSTDEADRDALPVRRVRGADRVVGMYVVDLLQGLVRFGAHLGPASTLAAAARSASGRLLALGTTGDPGRTPRVGLWDTESGRSPVRLDLPEHGEVYALAFSWDGSALWALDDRLVFGWTLPPALRDGAQPGRWPEQSRD